jgi:hypothetical protein
MDQVDTMLPATTPPPQHRTTGPQWEAVDLLLSDDLVVREMFEHIVEAEWPPAPQAPSPSPPGATGIVGGVEASRPGAQRTGTTPRRRHHHEETERWARERSPPTHPQHP